MAGEDDFKEQYCWVEKNIAKIIGIYGGRYIAVHEKVIVDSDKDNFELARRMELRAGFDLQNTAAIIKVPNSLEEWVNIEERTDNLDSPETPFPDFDGVQE